MWLQLSRYRPLAIQEDADLGILPNHSDSRGELGPPSGEPAPEAFGKDQSAGGGFVQKFGRDAVNR